jgi:glycosyltransferase involved in cell wall biosynthesis
LWCGPRGGCARPESPAISFWSETALFRNRVEDEVGRAGLEGAITVLGWVSGARVREEMLTSRALVLPSFYEGLSTVIMEAMALGRPVISYLCRRCP